MDRTDERALRALFRGALAATDGSAVAALPLALMRARREPALMRAVHHGLLTGLWQRLVREELGAGPARRRPSSGPTAPTAPSPAGAGPAARNQAGAVHRVLRQALRGALQEAAEVDPRDHHPTVVAMLVDAGATAEGDVEAGVELLMARLRQVRPEDAAALEALLTLAVALVVAEAVEGHQTARAVRSRAARVLERAAAKRAHSAAVARHARGAVASLRVARTTLERVRDHR